MLPRHHRVPVALACILVILINISYWGVCRALRNSHHIYRVVIDGIQVQGSEEFIKSTHQAMALLSKRPSFEEVRPYIARIDEADSSGMEADADIPTFHVGKATWQSEPIWYASTIVHDGYHSKLYHLHRSHFLWFDNTRPEAWIGKEAEKKCLNLQLQALQELNADAETKQYVETLMANPTYQDEAKRDW
jgi:hypothetical protein